MSEQVNTEAQNNENTSTDTSMPNYMMPILVQDWRDDPFFKIFVNAII
jgi:hypothetical protein